MNLEEYRRVENLDYYDYCLYLQEKYGKPKKAYFRPSGTKDKSITRTKEGFVIHHIKEDVAIMLSNEMFAQMNPYEYQLPDYLVYCDYLEHFFLHVLICEDLLKNPARKRNQGELPGYGGVVNFIGPELNDIYSGHVSKQEWRKSCADRVVHDKDVYMILVERFVKNYLIQSNNDINDLCKSFSASFGSWDEKNNKEIYKEIIDIYKKASS